VLSLRPPDASSASTVAVIVDFSAEASSGTRPAFFGVPLADGSTAEGSVEIEARDRIGQLPKLRPPAPHALIELTAPSIPETLTARLAIGDELRLPDGSRLGFDSLGYYARLSVVNNWALYPIYAAFVLALAGATLALLVPLRTALAEIAPDGDGSVVRIKIPKSKIDTTFAEQLEADIRSRLGVGTSGHPVTGRQ